MCIVYIRFRDRSCRGSSSECVYTGTTVQMIQFNTEAVVPFFVSSKGYGLLWDQYSASYLNPPSESERLNFKASPQMPGPGGSIADGTPAQLVSCHDDPRQGAFPACLQMSVSTPCCCLCLMAESFHLRLRSACWLVAWTYSAGDGSISLKSDTNKVGANDHYHLQSPTSV